MSTPHSKRNMRGQALVEYFLLLAVPYVIWVLLFLSPSREEPNLFERAVVPAFNAVPQKLSRNYPFLDLDNFSWRQNVDN